METSDLGKAYRAGEDIVTQGEPGDCMYVIQRGQVEILVNRGGEEVRVGTLGEGEFFGEMALFERTVRSATVRALERVRVVTVDRRTLLRRIQEDPTLAFRLLQRMSQRIRAMNSEMVRIKGGR